MGLLDRFRAKPVTAAAVQAIDQTKRVDKPLTESRESAEAWEVWRCLGEVRYVTTQQSRLVGRLDWTLTQGGGEPMDTESSDAVLEAAFGSGFRDLAKTAAIHLQVPGGYNLVRTRPNDNLSWKIIPLSPTQRQRKMLESADIVIEVREEDPKDPSRTTSPVLSALDVCRELILARAQARAQARNRTAQHGILVYALETKINDAQLMDVITAPLSDERTAASVTPNLLGVPKEYVQDFNKLDLSGDYDEKLHEKIDRLVRSLAVMLDAPPEILLGYSDANHWSMWGIQEDNWLGHIEPLASPIARGFAEALMQAAGVTDIVIEPDPGPLLQRRPTTADALAAYELDLVSGDWVREQIGADETDAPDAAELESKRPTPVASPSPPAIAEPQAASYSIAMPNAASIERLRKAFGPKPIAASARRIEGRVMAAIDQQAYDAFEDLVRDTSDRALEKLGAKVRTMGAQGGIDLPKDVPNMSLAINFQGDIPNGDAAVDAVIGDSLPKVERIVDRAFQRLRTQGVDLSVDPEDLASVWSLYQTLTTEVVTLRLAGKTGDAETWQAARRVVSVAGGNGDPAIGPVAAAAGVAVAGNGIALGKRSIAYIGDVYELVPGSYVWLHEYGGKHPHPEHESFNGRVFNGDFILEDGINYFPGDHAGCACVAVIEFVEAS